MTAVEELDGADVALVRAANPGPFTLTGTNTWVVGRDPAWVVDPGPADGEHLDAVARMVRARGGAGGIALTHDHADHSAGVEALLERVGAVAVSRFGAPADGPLEPLPVPGHADDHLVFVWGRVAFTGDAVLGEGSVFVAGDMAGYLDGLRRLRDRELELLCPGHGPVVRDARAHLDGYLSHRLERERRLLEALDAGMRGDSALLGEVWADAPAVLRPAALLTMNAHLRKLAAEGRLPADVEAPAAGTLPAV